MLSNEEHQEQLAYLIGLYGLENVLEGLALACRQFALQAKEKPDVALAKAWVRSAECLAYALRSGEWAD
jgi:hypothetical protein